MICVHKVWKLIGNNYDVTGKPKKEDILVFRAGFGGCTFGEQFISTLILVSY